MIRTMGLIVSFSLICACSSLDQKNTMGIPIDPQVKAELDQELQEADKLLESGKAAEAKLLYEAFQKKHQISIYSLRADIGRARSLEALGMWAESAQIYKEVTKASLKHNPEIAALSLYWSSYCYEALGDKTQVVAVLLDADRLGEHLPTEIYRAEIPARLSAAYGRMGQEQESRRHLKAAESAVIEIFGGATPGDPQMESKARVFYYMGSMDAAHLTPENMSSTLATLSYLQIFSLRSVEIENSLWSKRAFEQLKHNYGAYWRAIENLPIQNGLDAEAARHNKVQMQGKLSAILIESIAKIQSYKSPDEETPKVKNLFSFLDDLEKKAKDAINKSLELTPKTRKSKTDDEQVEELK